MLETLSFLLLIGIIRVWAKIFWRSEEIVIIINGILSIFALIHLSKLWAPFWPSSQKKTQLMVKLTQIQPGDTIYELWSGDGRILRACLPYHPHKIVGYEISWILILYSRLFNRLHKENIQYKRVDLFQQDFRDADVIFCFLLPQAVQRVEQEIRPTLKPWTRFVTNIFKLEHTEHHHKEGSLYVYIKTE
jgi:hypothetical protein